MLRKISFLLLFITTFSCDELQNVVNQLPQGQDGVLDVAGGLRQALDFGIDKQVSKLTLKDG